MSRLIVPIIVVAIVAVGIGGYFILQKPAVPQPPTGKCGDGVCDEREKANPKLCPNDCESILPKPPGGKTPVITGFKLDNVNGVREISRIHFELAKELKLEYILVPIKFQTSSGVDEIDWSAELDYYYILELSEGYGVKILPAFYKLGAEDDKNPEKYAEFVISFLDRFYKNGNIEYIEFQNEPVKDYNGRVSARFKGTPTDLARTHIAAYDAVKAKYPPIQVGTSGFLATAVTASENKMMNNYYSEYFSAKPKFDFLALHYYPKTSSYLQTTADAENSKYNFLSEYEIFDTYKKLFDDFGYSGKEIFATEGGVGMPFKNPDGTSNFQWLNDEEASILLTERFVLSLSKSAKNNIIGVFTSNSDALITGLSAGYNNHTGTYTKTKQFEFYKKLLEFLRAYPYHSKHIAGGINSTNYWVEEFKDKDEKRMWLAFCPFLFRADAESSERLAAVATEKSIDCPQEVILAVGNTDTAKISSLTDIRTIKVVKGSITFSLGKEPVFIEED